MSSSRSLHSAKRGAARFQAGFTLIEVMVATALLASMGGILVSMLWLTIDGQNTVRDTRDRLHAARVSLGLMSRELSMAFLSTHVDEEERRQTFFDGESDRIDFTTLAHRRLVRDSKESDAAEVGYYVGKDRRYPKQSVLIRRAKTPLDESPGKGGTEDVLAVGVQKLSFEYWDASDEEWESDWEVEFDDLVDSPLTPAPNTIDDDEESEHGTVLPYRIRISLVIEDAEGEDLHMETQTPIFMRRPFRFLQVAGKGKAGGRTPAARPTRAPQGRRGPL